MALLGGCQYGAAYQIGEIQIYDGPMLAPTQILPPSEEPPVPALNPVPLENLAPLDVRALRQALGQFATGVTVIATRTAEGALVGLTANSFGALSLEPPLVVWALRVSSHNLPVFNEAERFVVNVLAEAQVELSRKFATHASDKFDGVAFAPNGHGHPLIHGASAWFECRTVSKQIAGDHCLFIAEVERFTSSEAAPLLFHSGHYFALGSRL
jgi:flavin reductase (DIM6/NTAB) family NADH-FMN oxidoreductase RutF